MRLLVLVLVGVACLAVTHPAEASRTKRTIGDWFSKLWKRWKKEPEPEYEYHQHVYAVPIRQPVYHPPPIVSKPHYPPPTYHAPKGHHHGGHQPTYHAPKGHHHGGHAKGSHGKGGHGKGGGIPHGKGGGIPHGFGPVKNSDILHSGQSYHAPPPSVGYSAPAPAPDYSAPPPSAEYSAPAPAPDYSAPPPSVEYSAPAPAPEYSAPTSDLYGPPVSPSIEYSPPVESYAPPAQSYAPPVESYSPPVENYIPPSTSGSYSAPKPDDLYNAPPVSDSYSAPSAPIVSPVLAPVNQNSYTPPAVGNDYRAPPSFPPPMAAHGSSSSSYLEGSFQPSQPLPIQQALPAPPAPLYNLPVGPEVGGEAKLSVPDGAPAPIEVLPPAPLALQGAGFEEARSTSFASGGGGGISVGGVSSAPATGGGSIGGVYSVPATSGGSTGGGSIGGGYSAPATGGGSIGGGSIGGEYFAPAADVTYGSQLGYDDPIIEIVFQDGDPVPAPPPPIIDPELFALQDEGVEVYFIEYAPGDNLDDLAALSLDGAQPGILHDLPQELPVDVRNKLVGSGILEDAEIQVIDLQDAFSNDVLDEDTRIALEAVYGAESRIHETAVNASEQNLELRVHRLMSEQGSPRSTAELVTRLQNSRVGRYVGLVKTNADESDKYLPITVDGEKIPLPNTLNLEGQKITEVLVVANSENDKDEQKPPANSNDPEHNLVAEASALNPVIVLAEPVGDGIDRQWHGDPSDWRPVWN